MSIAEENNNKIDVLLIEDDDAHARLIQRKLVANGLPVSIRHKNDLERMHSEVARKKPDFLILDYLLPDGRSIDVLRETSLLNDIPTVLVTSFLTEQMVAEAQLSGLRWLVEKSESGLNDLQRIVCDEFSCRNEFQEVQLV